MKKKQFVIFCRMQGYKCHYAGKVNTMFVYCSKEDGEIELRAVQHSGFISDFKIIEIVS